MGMSVAIASGKGGTGKTTVAAALATVWDRPLTVVDLDVEEPNLHLFLNPRIEGRRTASIEVPLVDESRCTFCRACAELCQFKAISVLGEMVLTFTEMCHGCGGCLAVCPAGAITSGRRELGEIAWGQASEAAFFQGTLRVGEAMSPPLMRQVLADVRASEAGARDVLIDAPPGTSCPAVNAVMEADVVLLVTEPTPFGHYDLTLAHQAFGQLGKRMAVVINRAGIGTDDVQRFCERVGMPILAQIPYQREVAEAYAEGRIVPEALPGFRGLFRDLALRIRDLATLPAEVAGVTHD
jgi:MinD superfamily P-loop ATPase